MPTDSFLAVEYGQCQTLIKFYDDRFHALVKFAAGLTSGVLTVLLAIYKLGPEAVQYFWTLAAIVTFVAAIGVSAIFWMLVPQRLYFAVVARQLNAIRAYELTNPDNSGFQNRLYDNPDEPKAFHWNSGHIWAIAFVALQIGALGGVAFAARSIEKIKAGEMGYEPAVVALVVAAVFFFWAARYLSVRGKQERLTTASKTSQTSQTTGKR